MRKILFWAVMVSLSPAATPLFSQDVTFQSTGAKATLLELFSSEGCSSCPPAEDWVTKLKDSPRLWNDLFPVVFHVDYWDGLGWPDRFAQRAYTARQQTYASRLGQDSVYTPEFVANGREWRGWFHGEELPEARNSAGGQLTLVSRADGKSVSAVYAPGSPDSARDLTVNIAVLGFNVVSSVKGGENGGRELRHDFVVLGFTSKPLRAGAEGRLASGPVEVAIATDDPPAAVVGWISAGDGSPVQMAGGWLRSPPSLTAR